MRIRGNKDFYNRLNEIEKPVEIKGKTYYTVEHVSEDNEHLQHIRENYGIEEKETVGV